MGDALKLMSTDPEAFPAPPPPEGPLSPEGTVTLIHQLRGGDRTALDRLLERCLPPLRRWSHGRLPQGARGMLETADLVQDAVIAALRRLDAIEIRHQGELHAYLRQCVRNRIIDLARQIKRRPTPAGLPDGLVDDATSPLERAVGAENMARYDAALDRLSADDREAIIGRLELHYSYDELAVFLNRPSRDAARVAVGRAMRRLADELLRTPAPRRTDARWDHTGLGAFRQDLEAGT